MEKGRKGEEGAEGERERARAGEGGVFKVNHYKSVLTNFHEHPRGLNDTFLHW